MSRLSTDDGRTECEDRARILEPEFAIGNIVRLVILVKLMKEAIIVIQVMIVILL